MFHFYHPSFSHDPSSDRAPRAPPRNVSSLHSLSIDRSGSLLIRPPWVIPRDFLVSSQIVSLLSPFCLLTPVLIELLEHLLETFICFILSPSTVQVPSSFDLLGLSHGFFGKEPNCFTFVTLLSLDPSSDRAKKNNRCMFYIFISKFVVANQLIIAVFCTEFGLVISPYFPFENPTIHNS